LYKANKTGESKFRAGHTGVLAYTQVWADESKWRDPLFGRHNCKGSRWAFFL